MGKSGIIELSRRIIATALVTAAFIWFPRSAAVGVALGLAGLAAYGLIPRPQRPATAFVYERLPSVIVPDLLSFLLTAFFIALPFWAGEAGGPLVHPMALMLWPMALSGLFILVVATRYATYWLAIEDEGLRIHSFTGERLVRFADVGAVEPYRRGLPQWVRQLVPVLMAFGKYTQAGAVLLARDATGIRLRLHGGASEIIQRESFEKPYRKVLAALRAHAVPFNPDPEADADPSLQAKADPRSK